MSSFDDEFGLFSDESGDAERRPRLGARNLAEDRETQAPRARREGGGRREPRDREPRPSHPPADPVASAKRASDVLEFLAKKLVSKPDEVTVDLFADEDDKPVIELVVDPDDLGKVIGRNGRVAQALRTIVRAAAENRISVDILDSEEAAEEIDEDGDEEDA